MGNGSPDVPPTVPKTEVQKDKRETPECSPGVKRNELMNSIERETATMSLPDFLSETDVLNRLKRITVPPISEIKEKDAVTIQFHGNYLLQRQISAADVLPPEVRSITIVGRGITLTGTRRGLSGEFYATSGERLKIYSDTQLTVEKKVDKDEVDRLEQENKQKRTSIEKPDWIDQTEFDSIVDRSLSKGIDPRFVLALRKTENGVASGKHFGVMLDGIEGAELQLQMALKIIGRYEGRFAVEFPGTPVKDDIGDYTPEFLAYFSQTYSPALSGTTDPNLSNWNHFPNLISLYAGNRPDFQNYKSRGETFIDNLRNNRNRFCPNLDDGMKENIDSLIASVDQSAVEACMSYLRETPCGELLDISSVAGVLECGGAHPYIHKDVAQDLVRLAFVFHEATGQPFRIGSAYRTEREQADAIDRNRGSGVPTAPIGQSNHNTGHAIDMEPASLYASAIGGLHGFIYLAQQCNFNVLTNQSGEIIEEWHFDHSSRLQGNGRVAASHQFSSQIEGGLARAA